MTHHIKVVLFHFQKVVHYIWMRDGYSVKWHLEYVTMNLKHILIDIKNLLF